MSWGHEIIRAILLAFGIMQILTNSSYLIRKNGLEFARMQHGEIPKNVDNSKIKIKVTAMFIAGVLFFGSALTSYLFHDYMRILFVISASIFAVYAIMEALYYKYWKTFGFAFVTVILLVICIMV